MLSALCDQEHRGSGEKTGTTEKCVPAASAGRAFPNPTMVGPERRIG